MPKLKLAKKVRDYLFGKQNLINFVKMERSFLSNCKLKYLPINILQVCICIFAYASLFSFYQRC